jgi:hypothetical protein
VAAAVPSSLSIAAPSFQEDDADSFTVPGFKPRTSILASDYQQPPPITSAVLSLSITSAGHQQNEDVFGERRDRGKTTRAFV